MQNSHAQQHIASPCAEHWVRPLMPSARHRRCRCTLWRAPKRSRRPSSRSWRHGSAGGDGFCAAAGAFALMQEAGDVQPVIRWGRAWLEDNGFDRRARDVALTAALAHCDLAGQSPPQPLCSRAAHQCTECCQRRTTSLILPPQPIVEGGAGMSLTVAMWSFSRSCGVQRTGWKSTARTGCRTPQLC